MSVAEWDRKLSKSIPNELKPNLPTIEEIEAELGDVTVRKSGFPGSKKCLYRAWNRD